MIALLYISGFLFLVYGMSIFLIILFKNCSLAEAKTTLASFFKETGYSLSSDFNYLSELNKIVLDVRGRGCSNASAFCAWNIFHRKYIPGASVLWSRDSTQGAELAAKEWYKKN